MLHALHTLVWLVSLIPRAEGPLPKTVGPEVSLTLAGLGSLVGDLLYPRGSAAQRDRASRLLSAVGFGVGIFGYGLIATYQILLFR